MPTIPTRSSVSTLLAIPTVSRIGSHPKRPTALTTTQLECRFTFQTSSDDASRTFPQPIWKYERYGFWRLVGWQRTASAQVLYLSKIDAVSYIFFIRIAFGLMVTITCTPARDNRRFTFHSNCIFFCSFFQPYETGKPSHKKSAAFFNIVQTGGGVIPMFKNYVVNFV